MIPHPLSQYVSDAMLNLWGPEWNVKAERRWWLDILDWVRWNTQLYDHIPHIEDRYHAYERVINDVDLDSIRQRELVTHHDVKARIEEFNTLAAVRFYWLHGPEKTCGVEAVPGDFELVHWGMTSADVVDNISLIRLRAALDCLAYAPFLRTHEQGEIVQRILLEVRAEIPLRGIKGPVGTSQDMLDLLGSVELCKELDGHLADTYGFPYVLNSVGQVYPRSIDLHVASAVHIAVQECDNKRPWLTVLNGYLNMIASYSGDQWNEGDVSTSAVRRVALPGLFLAADAALRGIKP